jgi:hypothetical protein
LVKEKRHGGGFLFWGLFIKGFDVNPGHFRRRNMKRALLSVICTATIICSGEVGCNKHQSAGSDSVPVAQQPVEVMTVSPRILIGRWRGKDSLGHKIIFSFKEPPAGLPEIIRVTVQSGKRRVSGVCTYWENNMCDLKLETKELQNIRSRWFFKYDGTFLTIQLGDGQRIAEANIFTAKKE